MKKLFYGSIQVEVSGEDFARPEPFGQYPLQVNDVTEIHESLEKSTAKDEDSSQERWFTHLPPVLFFSLSRFKFNPQRQVAEKIHNRLEFPEVLYMDRYMSENKNTTRVKREEVGSSVQVLFSYNGLIWDSFFSIGQEAERTQGRAKV